MIKLLIDNPLLLLFLVAAIGYPLGHVKLFGRSLGIAAVLFVGLAMGALHPDMKLPEVIYLLGVVLFVYTIGISSGAGFVASFRRKGLRDNALIAGMLVLGMLLTLVLAWLLKLRPGVAAGMYAGSLTNTPALAGVLEYIKGSAPEGLRESLLAEPVVGYSIAYPIGVLGMIAAIEVAQRIWKPNYVAEALSLRDLGATNQNFVNRTVRVTKAAGNQRVADIMYRQTWNVIFGRMQRGDELSLVLSTTRLQQGDLVSVIGPPEDVNAVVEVLGEATEEHPELDRSKLDYRRMFVSNPALFGRSLAELQLPQRFGALITRVRRGDIELVPHRDMVLEPGDRVRVVAPRDQMEALGKYFGDSYKMLSEIDVMTFGLGIALGLLLGTIPIPLPGGIVFKLGFAGGPLVVSLILGAVARTGPLVWIMPYSANLTLRQIGLILFLAGVGTRSGYAFVSTFAQSGGLSILLAGAVVTCVTAVATLWVGYKKLRIPMSLLIGMLSGLQTQPAVLGYSLEQTKNDLPNIGYATVYPVAMIAKILLAQLILAVVK